MTDPITPGGRGSPAAPGPVSGSAAAEDRWISLPPLPELDGLRAAAGDEVIAEFSVAGGQVDIFVRPGPPGTSGYTGEFVLRSYDALPVVMRVRFRTEDGLRELIVPFTRPPVGPPVAEMRLAGLESGEQWEAREPRGLDGADSWTKPVITASAEAAADGNTRASLAVIQTLQADMESATRRAARDDA
jgi:hypothetical protein